MNKSACNHRVLKVGRSRVQGLLWDLLITHLPLWGSERALFPKATPDEPTLWKTAAELRWITVKCVWARKRSDSTKTLLQETQRRWNKTPRIWHFKCKAITPEALCCCCHFVVTYCVHSDTCVENSGIGVHGLFMWQSAWWLIFEAAPAKKIRKGGR